MVSDLTGADVAYAATFNLEEDVYYIRVGPPGGPSPTPTATATSTPTPAQPSVSGSVTYGNAFGAPPTRPVAAVLVSGAGSTPVTTFTNSTGSYLLIGFGGGSYTVTPSKSGTQNGG